MVEINEAMLRRLAKGDRVMDKVTGRTGAVVHVETHESATVLWDNDHVPHVGLGRTGMHLMVAAGSWKERFNDQAERDFSRTVVRMRVDAHSLGLIDNYFVQEYALHLLHTAERLARTGVELRHEHRLVTGDQRHLCPACFDALEDARVAAVKASYAQGLATEVYVETVPRNTAVRSIGARLDEAWRSTGVKVFLETADTEELAA